MVFYFLFLRIEDIMYVFSLFLLYSWHELSQKFSSYHDHCIAYYFPCFDAWYWNFVFHFSRDNSNNIGLDGWADSLMGELELPHLISGSDDRIISIYWSGGSWYECDDIGWRLLRSKRYECISSLSSYCYARCLYRKCSWVYDGKNVRKRTASKIWSLDRSWS